MAHDLLVKKVEHLAANFSEVGGDQTRAKRERILDLHSSGGHKRNSNDDDDVALCLPDVAFSTCSAVPTSWQELMTLWLG